MTILSSRNMLANVTFSGPSHTPTLVAASDPIPADLVAGPPTQGTPGGLELMQVDWTGFGWGNPVAAMSTWAGDRDAIPTSGGPPRVAIRGHGLDTLVRMPWAALPGLWVDLATCHQGGASYGAPDMGDHLLALGADGTLILVDQFGVVIGEKKLTTTVQDYWPFGLEPHAMLVTELVTNSGDYEQEIVVATSTGLMWLHVNDLLGTIETRLPADPGDPLASPAIPPSGYWMEVVHPTKLPASYHLNDGVLGDDEVAAGAVLMLTWQPGNATVQLQATLGPFYPTGATGGAYGVVGLKIGDVLAGEAGDELVVATMSGDVIVYSIGPAPSFILDEKWSSHLHGSIGFYNSIAIEDLNDGGLNELYVAGSLGLWRFTQPGEGTPGEGTSGE